MAGTARTNEGSATVVLVHGAWHGAWCWEPVVGKLREQRIEARAVDLPGHGADRGPLGDLHEDAERVRAVLDTVAGPVVLAGHSYGGAVITEAGEHPAVTRLVYLCALAIDAGETCATAAVEDAATAGISHEGRPNLFEGIRPEPDGPVSLDASVAAACLYNGCDRESTAWAVSRLGPQRLANFEQEPRAVAWRHRPSTYVVCTEDLAIHPALQRLLAKRCTEAVEWRSDHSPFLSQPDVVVALLADLARRGAISP